MRIRAGLACALMVVVASACGEVNPASLEFVEISPAEPRLGEITTMKFKAVDARGQPLAGALVNFRLAEDRAGVTLNPPSALTNKGDGIATTQVTASGGRPGSVSVIAES